MRILRVHWGFARMVNDSRVVPLFRHAPHEGAEPVSVGNVALAGPPAVPRTPPWFPIDPESDTQPIPAVRLSMDWAADLGEPRDPAMAMDPGIGIEPDLDDVAFGPRPVTEPEPAVPRTVAPVRRFLLAGLIVVLGLAVAVALTLALALAMPPR
jgi:hypothetical protein